MASQYFQHQLPGGLVLLGESMSGVQSAAMTLLLPAGAANDPPGGVGAATVLAELALRGAGERDSRQLVDHLDSLGLQRSSGVGTHHTHFSSAGLASRVVQGLPAYADIVRRPKLPPDGFEPSRDLALQALAGIDDDPRQRLVVTLKEVFFPPPLGRNPMGNAQDLQRLTLDICRHEHGLRYRGGGAILALAGRIDFDALRAEIDRLFGDFDGIAPVKAFAPWQPKRRHFQQQASEQTHIGLAYAAIPPGHADYYTMRVAIELFGGGASGRLFTELREKRGLVYNVWAGYSGIKEMGAILGYAGTSNDNAQATLDCYLAELQRLTQGVGATEVERARVGLKASTIMDAESTSSRAAGLAHDYFTLGRVRTLAEIEAAIDRVTVDEVNSFLLRNPPGEMTIVIVGPKELRWP